jgi:hypothetical protein
MKILRPEDVTSFPEPRKLTPDDLKRVYALAKAAFTADDLQRYAELDEGVPAAEVLRALEELDQRLDQASS